MKIKIVDSTFDHNNTVGLAGENIGEHPKSFQWDTSPGYAELKVWTDIRLKDVLGNCATKKIGWLIEPAAISPQPYRDILVLQNNFDIVLTHDKRLLDLGEPFKFVPFGGSWIKEWGVFAEKSKLVSMIVGEKNKTDGQRLRHKIASAFTGFDLYGKPYTDYLPSKVPMLRPYYYSIIIENCRQDYWFTEKLIDCFSQGTIPIYWGCPSIGDFFDLDGMYTFNTYGELLSILGKVSWEDYTQRMGSVIKNFEHAKQYRCTEDWIWNTYQTELEIDES